jgi:hypothetical protein
MKLQRRHHTGLNGKFFSALVVVSLLTVFAIPAAPADAEHAGRLPDAVPIGLGDGVRLLDGAYVELAFGLDLEGADGRTLFRILSEVNHAGQLHKALYIAHMLTAQAPRKAALWDNRAQIAANLGLEAEGQACTSNAARVRADQAPQAVAPSFVPGAFPKVQPASIEDWAAQLALIRGDIWKASDGEIHSVAVESNLSGVVPSSDATRCTATPRVARDVVPNLFFGADARPFRARYTLLPTLFAVRAGLLLQDAAIDSNDPDAIAQAGKTSGERLTRAWSRKSQIKSGLYEALRAKGAGGLEQVAEVEPKTCGVRDAGDLPYTLLWATGPSRAISVEASFAVQGDMGMRVYSVGEPEPVVDDVHDPNALLFPKLATLSRLDASGRKIAQTTKPLTLCEIMLAPGEAQEFGLSPDRTRHFATFHWLHRAFEKGTLSIGASFDRRRFIAADPEEDRAYLLSTNPRSWILSPASQ